MKLQAFRILFLFSMFFTVSCSENDTEILTNTPPTENQRLIKKSTETIYYGSGPGASSETNVTDFSYNGTMLDYTLSGNRKMVFTYNGDKVLTSASYTNDELGATNTFTYNGDLLVKTQSDGNGQSVKEFFYNGTTLIGSKSGYYDGAGVYILSETSDYVMNGFNVAEMTKHSYFFGELHTRMVFEYDNKINPVKFMNKYLRMIFQSEGLTGLGDNNITSRSHFSPVDNDTADIQNYEIEYDGDYPIVIRKYSGDYLISETFIEYL